MMAYVNMEVFRSSIFNNTVFSKQDITANKLRETI